MIVKAYEDGEEAGDRVLDGWCLKKQIVFARTTPAQKLLIVKANQRLGAIVGVLVGAIVGAILGAIVGAVVRPGRLASRRFLRQCRGR